MTYYVTERHNEIVRKIIEQIHAKLPAEQHSLLEEFVTVYYATVADEDLQDHNTHDLYGAVLSHWNFLYQRKSDEIKVRVFNPEYEQHGWQSTHSIVEISMQDMPFLIDSIRMALVRLGYTIHLLIHPNGVCFMRDDTGKVTKIIAANTKENAKANQDTPCREAIIYIEIDRETDKKALDDLQKELQSVLSDVDVVVQDWLAIKNKVLETVKELEQNPPPVNKDELTESIDFLRWIANNNFTFLGCLDYDLVDKDGEETLCAVNNSGMGLLRDELSVHADKKIRSMPFRAREDALSNKKLLLMQQLSEISTVHRPSAPYYIGVKRIDAKGNVLGERRFIGLYTSVAYHSSPLTIPFLRHKTKTILKRSGLSENGHAWKNLLNVLETYPRDELMQASEDELSHTSMGIFHLQERRKIRLFIRRDPYGRFYSCLVFIPRDQYTSELRERMGKILCDDLKGNGLQFSTHFSESILARVHFVVQSADDQDEVHYSEQLLERKLVLAARTWEDDFVDSLKEYYGDSKANKLIKVYDQSFPASYRETYPARNAVYDIEHMEKLSPSTPATRISMSLYRPLESVNGALHLKLFCLDDSLALSDILPMLENMGLRVMGERSHDIRLQNGAIIRINDFRMHHSHDMPINVDKVRNSFQEAFAKIWLGEAENDGFNRLILIADMTWRETALLRTYAKYMRQIGFTFSQSYIEETLSKYPSVVKKLMELFSARFGANVNRDKFDLAAEKTKIIAELETVSSLDEDRIIRRYLDLICATLRTNFYQLDKQGQEKSYISLKFDSAEVPELPLPRPMYEFFVYSPRVEGIHLRSSKVARGGIRWSDRREDFRTEVLGLMKAQTVKNAVIVPSGAKGGFVAKELPANGSRDEIMKEVISAYKIFISGMLDLTDNLIGQQIVPPANTVRYDDDDCYLVVAADKGTATFSDIANGISAEYNHWLGDAFASGGSAGYDHKKMGITARGAWESVKRHFFEMNIDVQSQDFTVVGIGDMAGDVFGNGMLMSRHIRLVAAFNHMHIFLDPNPNAEISYEERKRLFDLPRSTWADYNAKLISAGGGIYSRSAKSIKLSPEIMQVLDIKSEVIAPNELISAILCAPVDLLFNGGIGTYVKSERERHADVGDRANDVLRVNGKDLRCRVIGEGGNLGFTQLGRVEYALNGGASFTDFIDNSAGVDCSDHEVNIKILLNAIFSNGDITEKQRNALLAEMTEEVAELVLKDNQHQTRAISLAAFRASTSVDEYHRFIQSLERMGRLDRAIEFLPDNDEFALRKANNLGLTRPELSVILAYSKIILKEELLSADGILEDPTLSKFISYAFPKCLNERFAVEMKSHRMRREIIATQLSNLILNEMGATFVRRLYDETGASASFVVRSYIVAREVFDMEYLRHQIEALDKQIDGKVQMKMMVEVMRLLRRATRWFLRNRRQGMDVGETIHHFQPKLKELVDCLEEILVGHELDKLQDIANSYMEAGVPKSLAYHVAGATALISALDIIEAASVNNFAVRKVAETYFALGACLQLDWFREEIGGHPVTNNWYALARAACKDDLDRQQRKITEGVILHETEDQDVNTAMGSWMEEHNIMIDRWFYMVADLKSTKSREFTMYAVALRELLDLAQAGSKRYSVN